MYPPLAKVLNERLSITYPDSLSNKIENIISYLILVLPSSPLPQLPLPSIHILATAYFFLATYHLTYYPFA